MENPAHLSDRANATPQIDTIKSAYSEVVQLAEKRAEERSLQNARRQGLIYRDEQAGEARARFARKFGPRYAGCTLDNYVVSCPKQAGLLDALRAYIEEFPQHYKQGEGLVLFGPPGSGKDHLATATCIALWDRWPGWGGKNDVVFETGLNLYQDIRDGMKQERPEARTTDPLVRASLLVLSDPVPPRGPLTDWQAGILLQIIDARYRAMRPTIVTLNIASGAEGDERMGPQVLDRLKDGALSFFCDWPSHRKARA